MQNLVEERNEPDPVIALIRDGTRRLFGARLARIVLYGSRAKGDARPDSDYDVAVFLRDFEGLDRELDRTAALSSDIQEKTGAVISMLPFPSDAFAERTVTMNVIRNEGVVL